MDSEGQVDRGLRVSPGGLAGSGQLFWLEFPLGMLSCRVSRLVKRCAGKKNLIRKLEVEREVDEVLFEECQLRGCEE